ncbi:UDP-N-acetylglucosamine--N-acetylmuramyl-(pentapeptide) pyrophosphoryl-undecaprenol N-acetylglucosamine transferase [Candidatus Gottesmanbacteria bacterium]|nr:UDP-N-acetylglucosamine--N-acetylmuramyl-(pentapeptide) pyrophosphoryl-undecaprenol N-acetylglucosamine transferase [Candidatus Gottesmanbacteria bacterium]
MKVCITGGHLSPALATAAELQIRHPDWKIIWIGRTKALAGDREVSTESLKVKELGIPFFPLTTGRLNRTFSLETLLSVLYIPLGFFEALRLVLRESPSIIVSFGGYLALPVVVAGGICRIPVVTHEQTRVPGLANKIIAVFADTICVSFPEMTQDFWKKKVICTGLPLRKELFVKNNKMLPFSRNKKPLLYIGGGTTGSVSMNALFFSCLTLLLKDFQIVHQTGSQSYESAMGLKNTLSTVDKDSYIPLKYLGPEVLKSVYVESSLYIGRSGANTVYELAVFGKPSIFIPLPWSSGGEQQANAEFLALHGGALVLEQQSLESLEIPKIVRTFYTKISQWKEKMKNVRLMFPVDGAIRLADVIDGAVSTK